MTDYKLSKAANAAASATFLC